MSYWLPTVPFEEASQYLEFIAVLTFDALWFVYTKVYVILSLTNRNSLLIYLKQESTTNFFKFCYIIHVNIYMVYYNIFFILCLKFLWDVIFVFWTCFTFLFCFLFFCFCVFYFFPFFIFTSSFYWTFYRNSIFYLF